MESPMLVIPFGHLIFNKLKRVYQFSEVKTKSNHTEIRRRSDAQATESYRHTHTHAVPATLTERMDEDLPSPDSVERPSMKDFMEIQNLEMSRGDGDKGVVVTVGLSSYSYSVETASLCRIVGGDSTYTSGLTKSPQVVAAALSDANTNLNSTNPRRRILSSYPKRLPPSGDKRGSPG
mmetsp:Transcript_60085/g.72219  ORF Transcript_60085/g.72219 Transcript_60085/m.72219 type:complete len:178 (-) Transcript_60085:133-666(-)